MFHMTLGEYDYNDFNETPYPAMAKVIFVFFQIFIPILLFNMLIAMMGKIISIYLLTYLDLALKILFLNSNYSLGNTYASVNEKSEKANILFLSFQC